MPALKVYLFNVKIGRLLKCTLFEWQHTEQHCGETLRERLDAIQNLEPATGTTPASPVSPAPYFLLFRKWCHVTDEGNLNDSFIRSFFKMFMPRNSFTQLYTESWSYTKGGLKHSKAPKARADFGFRSSQQDDPKWWLQVINHILKSHC